MQTKKDLSTQGHEAVTNDVVAQIHIDEKAEQLFLWADTEDRNANFNKYVKLVCSYLITAHFHRSQRSEALELTDS